MITELPAVSSLGCNADVASWVLKQAIDYIDSVPGVYIIYEQAKRSFTKKVYEAT